MCSRFRPAATLPAADGRVQMYPCYAFETHVVYAEIDRVTGQVALGPYTVGHDCGVMINPDIVHGMTYGGVAHGIGAALYERFPYDETGQFLSGTFMDYLIPSAHEVPDIEDRRSLHAVAADSVRTEGLGRGGISRRAGGDCLRGQRRVGAVGTRRSPSCR